MRGYATYHHCRSLCLWPSWCPLDNGLVLENAKSFERMVAEGVFDN